MKFMPAANRILAVFFLFFVNSVLAQTVYQMPAGTKLKLRMDNEINSSVSTPDDTFTAVVIEPVKVRETVVLPIGAIVEGRITEVKKASSGGRGGEIKLVFETLRLEKNVEREIEGELTEPLKAESTSQAANALTIVGAAAAGALIGKVARSGTGAGIGAAIGAGAGTGAVYLRKGKEARIKADEVFEIELTKNVILPVKDF